MRTVWQCEKDEYRRRVLGRHWPDIERWDDVREVARHSSVVDPFGGRDSTVPVAGGERSYGPIHLLCGGFPCQDLSVAGRRKGLEGDRSGLFYEYARIADELRPRWLLVENVPGLLSSADGRDFAIVLRTLADIGYGLAWRVLDARFFGVPQRRRRVFIVGHLGGDPGPAVLAVGAGGEGDLEAGRCSWQDAPVRARGGANGSVVVSALDRQAGGPDDNSAQAGHLTSNGSGVRRLTPTECERLMSWPDGWTLADEKTADSRRYAACGDGVVSNVAEWIGQRIKTLETANPRPEGRGPDD
jgi:DNA (cytosine-5)-methyltransferase 1